MIAWSCGGGTQSVAIGVLIGEGALPVPDLAGISDTGREVKTTWEYMANVLNPYLKSKKGFEVEIIPHSFARVDMYDKSGLTLMPAYTTEGRLPSFCAGEWKRDAMERWLRSKGVKNCVQWIGFSKDEERRATYKAHRPWCVPAYPLLEKGLTKDDCIRLIQAAGLPLPRKSRCWQCPHQNAAEWSEIKGSPEEWEAAVALEKQINELDPEQKGLFLHSSRVPLAMANLEAGNSIPLFRECQDAACFT